MTAKEFIYTKLRDLANYFPQIRFRYQYDELQEIHMVEVTPIETYLENQEYKESEGDLTYEFDRTFAPETIMFVSEDSLTCVTKPEKVFGRASYSELTFSFELDQLKKTVELANFASIKSLNSLYTHEFYSEITKISTIHKVNERQKNTEIKVNNYALAA